MVSAGATAVAVITLVWLYMRGGGGRIAITFAVLAGAAIPVAALLAEPVFGGIGAMFNAMIHAVAAP